MLCGKQEAQESFTEFVQIWLKLLNLKGLYSNVGQPNKEYCKAVLYWVNVVFLPDSTYYAEELWITTHCDVYSTVGKHDFSHTNRSCPKMVSTFIETS